MTIKVKSDGAYIDIAGIFVKKGGVYTAVQEVYAKIGGVYQPIPIQPGGGFRFDTQIIGTSFVFA